MTGRHRAHDASGVFLADEFGNIVLEIGQTVPTGGGYVKGGLFIDDDAASGTAMYVNQGTVDSSTFNEVTSTNAIASTAGTTTLADACNLALNTSTGTKIGTAAGQKLGFWGAAPVAQASHIANPDSTIIANNAAIDAILVVLENAGLTATS